MHEFSMSNALAKTVLKSAKENKAKKITSINIEIGKFTFLNPEQVRFWLKQLFKKTLADNARIYIRGIKPKARCNGCNYEWDPLMRDDPFYHFSSPRLMCPKCESSKVEIIGGRKCLIKNIRIMK